MSEHEKEREQREAEESEEAIRDLELQDEQADDVKGGDTPQGIRIDQRKAGGDPG